MIDIKSETLVPIGAVPKIIPSSRPGKKLNVATVWRWIHSGTRGRKLEAVRCGGCMYTTVEAVGRFITAPNADGDTPTVPLAIRSPARRRREQAAAARKLDAAGIK